MTSTEQYYPVTTNGTALNVLKTTADGVTLDQLEAAESVLSIGSMITDNTKNNTYTERFDNVANIVSGFNTGVTDLSERVIGMMTTAISKSKESATKLKHLIQLALVLLFLQIPIMFLSICFNRSKACHGCSNIVWVKNVLICVGFGFATYY